MAWFVAHRTLVLSLGENEGTQGHVVVFAYAILNGSLSFTPIDTAHLLQHTAVKLQGAVRATTPVPYSCVVLDPYNMTAREAHRVSIVHAHLADDTRLIALTRTFLLNGLYELQ